MHTGTAHKTQEIPSPRDTSQTRGLAWWLDSSIPLPGGFRIGLDGIIGLIPGFGDAVGGGLSAWILYQAYKAGAPKMVLTRMLINVLVDAVLGAIPILGDLFDFFWKANQRNADLLDNYRRSPRETYRRSAISTFIFFVGVVGLAILLVVAATSLVAMIWNALTQGP